MESIFAAIEAADQSECGKLLVCNAMTKSEAQRSHSESIILKLFPLEARWVTFELGGRYEMRFLC